MTEKIKNLLDNLSSNNHRNSREEAKQIDIEKFLDIESHISIMQAFSDAEKPLIHDGDIFGFNRSTIIKPPWRMGNVTPNYARVITQGFDKVISDIKENIKKSNDESKKHYGEIMLGLLDICVDICDDYRVYANETGNTKLYNALLKVPHHGATTFYEALVFMKICIYVLRLYGATHLTLGRFDQYMYPFYLSDKKAGISDEELFETLEAFFIALNYDTDLYHGVQYGDNGQSMILAGFDKDGNSMYNELSKMCMQASLELSLVDPKINLRVGKNTPDELYEYGTLLTKQGLGFPQYCNDDVVIPGLLKLGYSIEDAIEYSVAACWEYIIPNCGADIPNFATFDFPRTVNDAITANLAGAETFDSLMTSVRSEIKKESKRIAEEAEQYILYPMPLLSVFIDGCIESLTDMWEGGAKYLNYGSHGAGIANATDALAAVKKNIYDEKTIKKEELLDALAANFDGYSEIRSLLKNSPKMGNNDNFADDIAAELMTEFANNINNRDNAHGGIWRAGTGSAMEYLWKGEQCPATADGRYAGDPYSSSFSPSLDVKTTGLLSVIQSFSKYDMTNIINGGPLTIEIHDTVLRNDIGIKKTAMLVKNFILLGGHQLQLNSINRERLLDAQKHPEKYPNLITRVWGWSGYFNELDVKYQNHIIRRSEYTL